jgi:hypothetical protein
LILFSPYQEWIQCRFVYMIENVINFVSCLFSSPKKKVCAALDTRTYSNIISVSPPRKKNKVTKKSERKQNNLQNPHFYCFAVRFDVILSYTLQLFGGGVFAQFQSHHHKKLCWLVKDFRQM